MSSFHPLANLRRTFSEYPRQFWILIGATFIDNVGGALLFPFFTLYITARFGVGMTTVGLIFAVYSIASVFGSAVGGALTDRFGRKTMLLFGLLASALSSLLMGFVSDIAVFAVVAVFVGLFTNTGGPAQQAMVADLLPEHRRADGYGIQRVIQNLAVVIGPAIGGLMAAVSYLLLFITDAVTSVITAIVVYFKLDESKPEQAEDEEAESLTQTFVGYLDVLHDRVFLAFLVSSGLAALVFMQMHTTLAVYLRDTHGVPARGFGYLLSMNALMVVLLQFPITRRISRFSPMLMMAAGTLLYSVGFGLYGIGSSYPLFVVAMIIITVGEMIVMPVSQALVAHMSPEMMRGRYMAVYGFTWVLPTALAPLLAGLIMDNTDSRWVWLAALVVGIIAAAMYFAMYHRGIPRKQAEPDAA